MKDTEKFVSNLAEETRKFVIQSQSVSCFLKTTGSQSWLSMFDWNVLNKVEDSGGIVGRHVLGTVCL